MKNSEFLENSSMFHSAYDDIPLEEDTDLEDEQNLPFIDEEKVLLRKNNPNILRVEQSMYESIMENSQGILPDLEFKESRESFYWRWIFFGVPAFYGLLIAFVSIIRTFAGYYDYMTKFCFWWFFTFTIGILTFRLYTNWKKKRDAHFLNWWLDRPLEGVQRDNL